MKVMWRISRPGLVIGAVVDSCFFNHCASVTLTYNLTGRLGDSVLMLDYEHNSRINPLLPTLEGASGYSIWIVDNCSNFLEVEAVLW